MADKNKPIFVEMANDDKFEEIMNDSENVFIEVGKDVPIEEWAKWNEVDLVLYFFMQK